MATYYVNDVIRLSAAFRNAQNALTNPTTTTITITVNGTPTTYTYGSSAGFTNPTVGNFQYTYTATTTGSITYVWDGLGAIVAESAGSFTVASARTVPSIFWSPANDHLVIDGLETVTLTTLAATTTTIYRVLRLPALVDIGSAGALTSYGNITRWNIWIQECPTAPEINALLTDAANVKYRINNVTQSVQRNMWEIETTADAGVGL
jgi:hypothetical protein